MRWQIPIFTAINVFIIRQNLHEDNWNFMCEWFLNHNIQTVQVHFQINWESKDQMLISKWKHSLTQAY